VRNFIYKILAGVVFCNACIAPVLAENAFIAKYHSEQNEKVLQSEGDCNKCYAPCSTFKILLSLIGFDSGILTDETNPVWPFKQEYDAYRDAWKQDQTPITWIKESCVWYSQVLTQQLGVEKFQEYVTKFHYGNMDLSGDVGQNNGLTQAWLSSSLEISANEQLAFLEKLLAGQLPVSAHAHTMTQNILFVQEWPGGWKLYGKTGSGYLLKPDRTEKLDIKHGWFVGWIEKDDQKIIFVHHIVDDKPEDDHAGPRAKEGAIAKLTAIIENIKDSAKP